MQDLGKLEQRVLVFGGPYSNLAATRAMRERAIELGLSPRQVICTGDLVAYCGEPAETLELIRDWGIAVIMGNCEESLAQNQADCGCGFEPGSSCSTLAITWYDFARRRINAEHRQWLRNLPRGIDFELGARRFRVLHGSPLSINEFVFASSDMARKQAQLEGAGVDAIIGGHCGIPFGQRIGDGLWLNAGVIGMPANDADPRVWYMLLDEIGGGLRASWHRLDYDYASSRDSTVAAGMREYGQALEDGLWPSMDVLPDAERAQRGRPLDLPSIEFS